MYVQLQAPGHGTRDGFPSTGDAAQGSHRGADADMDVGHGDLPLTRATAAAAHACARSCWKIENETFNTLKN